MLESYSYRLKQNTLDYQGCENSASESERRRKGLKKILEKSREVGLKSTEYQIIKEIKILTFYPDFHMA